CAADTPTSCPDARCIENLPESRERADKCRLPMERPQLLRVLHLMNRAQDLGRNRIETNLKQVCDPLLEPLLEPLLKPLLEALLDRVALKAREVWHPSFLLPPLQVFPELPLQFGR